MDNLFEQYYTLRERRLAIQREADSLEQQERDTLYEITKRWDFCNVEVSGTKGGYKYKGVRKDTVVAVDWGNILSYIKETGEVDLLQKRLTESAVKARWDAGRTIPGVEKSLKWAVAISKDI